MDGTLTGSRNHGLKQTRQSNKTQQLPSYYHTDDLNKNYTGYSTSPLFPHFPPPPEYPPPESQLQQLQQQHQHHQTLPVIQKKQTLVAVNNSRYPDDPDCIEICIEQDPIDYQQRRGKPKAKPRTTVNYAKNYHQMGEQTIKWNRNNIAVTMERYEPSSTSSQGASSSSTDSPIRTNANSPLRLSPAANGYHPMQQQQQLQQQPQSQPSQLQQKQHHHHQDYAYAYYEPGMAMRHSNVPNSVLSQDPGPSRPPPPNSIRALLNTASRKNSPSSRYGSRYGTQENIYEEISADPRIRIMSAGSSMVSLNQSMVEEEFRRIQSRHRRILGELNLSVEAMLMPESPPNASPTRESPEQNGGSGSSANSGSGGGEHLNELLNSVGPTDELLSPVSTSAVNGDMDSGFSGSSSSASYVGSLRYHRTGSQTRSSTPGAGGNNSSSYNGSIRSSQRSNEDPGITSAASHSFNSVYEGKTHCKKASDDSDAKQQKPSFWSRKGWRKIPGFSSTSSVNKAGLNGE